MHLVNAWEEAKREHCVLIMLPWNHKTSETSCGYMETGIMNIEGSKAVVIQSGEDSS